MLRDSPRGRRRAFGLVVVAALVVAVAVSVNALAGGGEPSPGTRASAAAGARPTRVKPPRISGAARVGARLVATRGGWRRRPRSFAFRWMRCDRGGAHCSAIAGAQSSGYVVSSGDVGATIRVSVVAANRAGRSKPALSAHTGVIVGSTAASRRLEYVFDDGLVSVYDIDRQFQLVETISLPQTEAGIRGATVSPATHMLFISYGGDGGEYGDGSVLAYDLVAERVVWTVHLHTGVDSGAVSPDGSRLYMPTGENESSGIWNILDTSNGAVIGKIQGGSGAHNTIASADGRYVYLGGRDDSQLDVYETSTGHVRHIGPLVGGARPFTVNSSNTIAFTTSTGADGFQVSNVTTGKVLFTVSFGSVPGGFPFSAPSHGISLSPDEREVYVIDSVKREVHVYDVSGVARGVAPAQVSVIPVRGLTRTGSERPCAYDCALDGWVQHSLDGRFVYVGDSGEVIDTSRHAAVATLGPLANTRKFLEIDWANGVPVATSGRTGVGHAG